MKADNCIFLPAGKGESQCGTILAPEIEKLMIEANRSFLEGVRASDADKFREILKYLRSSGVRAGTMDSRT